MKTIAEEDDVEVSEIDGLHLDKDVKVTHRAVFDDGLIAYFATEETACLFQLKWRDAISVNP